jgi:hypothetical protein
MNTPEEHQHDTQIWDQIAIISCTPKFQIEDGYTETATIVASRAVRQIQLMETLDESRILIVVPNWKFKSAMREVRQTIGEEIASDLDDVANHIRNGERQLAHMKMAKFAEENGGSFESFAPMTQIIDECKSLAMDHFCWLPEDLDESPPDGV